MSQTCNSHNPTTYFVVLKGGDLDNRKFSIPFKKEVRLEMHFTSSKIKANTGYGEDHTIFYELKGDKRTPTEFDEEFTYTFNKKRSTDASFDARIFT